MKTLLTLFTLLNLLNITTSFANERGNGGAGIERNGKYLTFQSAALSLTPVAEKDISSLVSLLKRINKMPMASRGRGKILDSLIPSGKRKYFKTENISEEERIFLKKQYKEILSQNDYDKLELFAFTKERETYLLPAFFALGPIEQQAILMHEAAWVLSESKGYSDYSKRSSTITYEDVVTLEMYFQKYLEDNRYDYDVQLYYQFGKIINDPSFILESAAIDDYKMGRFSKHLNSKGEIPYSFLFGSNLHETLYSFERRRRDMEKCYLKADINKSKVYQVKSYIKNMTYNYPSMNTFKALFSVIDHFQWENAIKMNGVRNPSKCEQSSLSEISYKLWTSTPSGIFNALIPKYCSKYKKPLFGKKKCVEYKINRVDELFNIEFDNFINF